MLLIVSGWFCPSARFCINAFFLRDMLGVSAGLLAGWLASQVQQASKLRKMVLVHIQIIWDDFISPRHTTEQTIVFSRLCPWSICGENCLKF